jgi:hypothetical protein
MVDSAATRWAEWGGPLLTTTSGWNRRMIRRAFHAARSTQPRPSSGNARSAATSLSSQRSLPGGAGGVAARTPRYAGP